MRKSLLFSALLAVGIASPAMAQQNAKAFPKLQPTAVTATPQSTGAVKAPAAYDDKGRGKLIYAVEQLDYNRQRGFVKFYTGNPYSSVEKVITEFKENTTTEQLYGARCGAFDGNRYYAYLVNSYSAGFGDYPQAFISIDPLTGEYETIAEYDDSDQPSWPTLYEMAYDYSSETMFALGQGVSEDNPEVAASILYTIDLSTGDFEEVTRYEGIYLGLAFDYDGKMYATAYKYNKNDELVGTNLVIFDDNYQVDSTVNLTLDGANYEPYYCTSMEFDHTTGDLYWLPQNSSMYEKVVKIDTSTGVMTDLGSVTLGTTLNGLYIPFLTADSREAAGQVTSIDAAADETGTAKANVSWTNPAKAWNNTELSQLEKVLVYRKLASGTSNELSKTEELLAADNSELVATLDATGVGQAQQWTDENPLNGVNTYYIVPCRVSGELGVPDSVRCYVGLDVPAAVSNATLVKDGNNMNISWTAPTQGVNKGYINPDDVTYTITRMPDNKVVATGVKGTSYTDASELGEENSYYYIIQGANASGEGATAETNSVVAGKPFTAPYLFTFDTEGNAGRWTVVDNAGSHYFEYSSFAQSMLLIAEGGSDDWIISPSLSFKAGHTYKFKVKFNNAYADTPYNVKMTVGTDRTAASQTNVIYEESDVTAVGYYDQNMVEFTGTYTAEADGVYYFGYNISGTGTDNYYVHSVHFTEVSAKDLEATSLNDAAEAVAEADNKCTVTVTNVGTEEQSAYKVKVVCKGDNGDEVVGETTDVPAIKAGRSANVELTFKPTIDGTFDFVGVVELEGDGDVTNDTTAAVKVSVSEAGRDTWTTTATDSNLGSDTNVPFSYNSSCDISQSLYLASDFEAPAEGKITRIGYEYDGNDNLTDRTPATNLKVYMGSTDKTSFYAYMRASWWACSEDWAVMGPDVTLVYDGDVTVEPGHNILALDLIEPYEYDRTKNLLVLTIREGSVDASYCWPVLWKTYNNVDLTPLTDTEAPTNVRTLRFSKSTSFNNSNKAEIEAFVPVLHMAFGTGDAIFNATAGDKAVSYDAQSGKLVFGNGVKAAQVYDLTGKLVRSYQATETQSTVSPSLSEGLYIVRALSANGEAQSVKLSITK